MNEREIRQISTLLYCLNHDAKDTLHLTNLTGEEQKDYSKVVEKLGSHFKALTQSHLNLPMPLPSNNSILCIVQSSFMVYTNVIDGIKLLINDKNKIYHCYIMNKPVHQNF